MRITWLPISLAAALSVVTVAPRQVFADTPEADAPNDKATCEQAFEQAQREQNQSHYLAAKKQTLICANPKCGDAIFNECTRMYGAIEQATPSVVLAARDTAKAVDLSDVNVTIDGQSVTDHLDGKPLSIDPGVHMLVFSAANYAPEERKLLIGAGDKYRQVSVTLISTEPPVASVVAPPPVAPAETPPRLAPRKVAVASYVLGGVGVAAIGGGIVLRLLGANKYNSLQSSCSPNCKSSDVDPVKTKYVLSDVAFGVGAAALVGAVVIYAAAPRHAEPSTAFMIVPMPGGATAGLSSTF